MDKQYTKEQFIGIIAAAGSYLLWGILPIYWKLVQKVPAHEILAHRIVWSFMFMTLLLLTIGKLRAFITEFYMIACQPKKLFGMFMASAIISINWFTYIWAVNHNHILDTSLGYYLNPLISVLLGIFVLKEKLSFWQMFSFFLASIGVLNMAFHVGTIPWVTIVLAFSFALYGLIKKVVNVGAIASITIETLFMMPFALLYLGYVHKNSMGAFGFQYPTLSMLLMGAGVVTAVPLILFSSGAKRLPLSFIGFIQYMSPTITLLLGVFLYHESFNRIHLISFSFIWFALIIFSLAKTKPFMQLETILHKKMTFKKNEATQ
ncbi:RarD protein, DMT superfamily transporter [Desulforamulus reducens MI-1]|uniref:RarD protein, DMT superfamily transporter n=1 Tax=Desulforamulus reducens (strain ATCC BAA-1160 / DSM 100696 / MI-1) TaxID=349161 RepID=A4J258_DESRM|nr:EamA family transporter RarD [Desulforamulus reducens]ABO49161.1 RarD protein, DMT superfamily transporter [Desulforamulus reducens MI-1]